MQSGRIRRLLVGAVAAAGAMGFASYISASGLGRVPESSLAVDAELVSSNRVTLEAKLDLFDSLPPNAHHDVFSRLSPDVKSVLWRAHYDRWLASGMLTSEQRILLQRARDMATPAL